VTVLVTGGGGFLGRHLARRLLDEGEKVRVLVRAGRDPGDLGADVEVAVGDVRNESDCERAIAGCTAVFHLAAITARVRRPEADFRTVNAGGTANVARAAAATGTRRFVLASTTAVYGTARDRAIDELTPPRPSSFYGHSKLQAEQIALEHARNGLEPVIARITSAFGAGGQSWAGLFRSVAAGRMRLIGAGHNYQHPAAAQDIAAGLSLCGSRGTPGHTYLLAGPEALTLRTMLEVVAEAVGAEPPQRGLSDAPLRLLRLANELAPGLGARIPRFDRVEFFLSDRVFDISRAREELGYRPAIRVRQAVRETADWLRERGELP
jgi:nucleoside-diphosphate-sugar epimerase